MDHVTAQFDGVDFLRSTYFENAISFTFGLQRNIPASVPPVPVLHTNAFTLPPIEE